MATVALSVRIEKELHRRVRLKAFEEEVAVEALLRGWLAAYADGLLFADGARVMPEMQFDSGAPVAIGEITKAVEEIEERERSSRLLKPHAADPKDKATQEHGKREKKPRSGLCQHRVPVGVFCKRCDEEGS